MDLIFSLPGVRAVPSPAVLTLCGLCHVFPYWSCWKDEGGHGREELQSLGEEGDRNHLEELKQEGAEQRVEQKVKTSLQCIDASFCENIDLRHSVKIIQAAVRDTWAERQAAVEQSVPLPSCRDVTTAQVAPEIPSAL